MDNFYINFLIAAIFMISTAIYDVHKEKTLATMWGMIAGAFIINGIFCLLIDSLKF